MVPIEEAMHGNDSGQTKSPKLPQEPSAAQAAKVSPTNSPILNSSSSSSSGEISGGKWLVTIIDFFNDHFAWVPNNWHWSKLKPVIRCAVTAWISLVLFVIPAFERALGQASFLILIAAILSPPSDPFMSVLERETLILLFVTAAWGWACFAIFLANLARHIHNPTAPFLEVVTGKYIEAAPTIIMAIFVFVGSALFLYIKARQGPGPYTFACVFACICIDISLTTAALFPYPFYLIGRAIAAPIACHSGLALLASVLVFPSTNSALFTTRLTAVTAPMLSTLEMHRSMLSKSIHSSSFAPDLIILRTETKKVEGALVPLAAAARMLKSDLIYARFAPEDFRMFQALFRRLAGRADGLGVYFALVDPGRERFPGTANPTPAGTASGTPRRVLSRATSRGGSQDGDLDDDMGPRSARSVSGTPRVRLHAHGRSTHSVAHAHLHLHNPLVHSHSDGSVHGHDSQHHHHHILHSSLLSLARSRARARKPEYAVGTFESQRYLNLEMTRLHDPHEEEYVERTMQLLKESCDPLLQACHLGIGTAQTWLGGVREGRMKYLLGIGQAEAQKRHKEKIALIEGVRDKVRDALAAFREFERHAILDPYRPAFVAEGYHTPGAASPPTSPPTALAHLPSQDARSLGELDLHGLTETKSRETVPQNGELDGAGYGSFNTHTAHDSFVFKQQQQSERDGERDEYVMPPHRYLFHCYVYQYSLIQVAAIVVDMLDEILRLEKERPVCKLWTPVQHAFRWNPYQIPETVEQMADDEDPNVIQGIPGSDRSDPGTSPPDTPRPKASVPGDYESHGGSHIDLGLPRRRDPEALPPQNLFESVMRLLYRFAVGLSGGNAVFSLKAGVLTVLLCLPSFIKHSAAFAYDNRFVWAIFMGQLTIARFRGETTFGLTARITSTFFGGITGMVMWYISCGSGGGNAYGLAAVCFVCFPFFFFGRLYWPVPPMVNIVFFVTSVLVVGYSYQDQHIIIPGSPGAGFSVFWKRFTLVTVGVVAAFIASFLPPSTTIRRYQRNLLATTLAEMGSVYCNILSFANTKHEAEVQDIVSNLLAVRNKLGKSAALNLNIIYEFSLRGRWPAERYQKIADLQMALSYSLSHLMSVLEHLEPSWSRAFLQRTRFMDPGFQGDILAVISMISLSLRTGTPLPQITPCPLLDRFTLKYHGLDVIHKDSEEDYGLPRTLSLDTLRNEQYLMFSVGISTAYGVINRLDMLMLAVKEVVGEQYHIHGVGAGFISHPLPTFDFNAGTSVHGSLRGPGVELGERTNTVHFD